jgi:hypothetical protein
MINQSTGNDTEGSWPILIYYPNICLAGLRKSVSEIFHPCFAFFLPGTLSQHEKLEFSGNEDQKRGNYR